MNAPDTARCPHCFGATRVTPCPHCGWQPGHDNLPPALALGQLLDGRYRIGRVLGHGGFGITYLAWDDNLHLRLAIKEYLPRDCASRAPDGISLAVYPGPAGEQFAYGLDRFLEEARTLAHFDQHPGIVTVKNFFRAHGTGYCVMDYVEGITLRQYLDQQPGGRISIDAALKLLMPVADALRAVHKEGLLHRDIAPDNIYLTQDGRIKLLDFGAARFAAGEHSRSLSVILKPGYSPEEQYRAKGKQGPWTDVYGLAATLYRALTGQIPPESLDRLDNDDLVPPSRLGIAIAPGQEATLLQALAVKAGQRFQSMAELQKAWRTGGGGAAPQSAGSPSGPFPPEKDVAPTAKPKRLVVIPLLLTLGILGFLSAMVALVPFPWSGTNPPTLPQAEGASTPITSPAPVASPVTTQSQTPATSEVPKASPLTDTKAPAETPVPATPAVAPSTVPTSTRAISVPSTAGDSGGSNKAKQGDATEPPGDASPNERYRFVGKDQVIVEDTRTKLQWQRCSLGQTWNGASCAGEAKKYNWDEARRIAPSGWRLPTKEELASLVYCSSGEPTYWKTASETCKGAFGSPTIWSAAFPNTPKSWFWSSSPNANPPHGAWSVNFSGGHVEDYGKYGTEYVRFVRGGQQSMPDNTEGSSSKPPQALTSAPTGDASPQNESHNALPPKPASLTHHEEHPAQDGVNAYERQPALPAQPAPCYDGIAELERRFIDSLKRNALTKSDNGDTAKSILEKVLENMNPNQRCQWNGALSDRNTIKADAYRRISDRYIDLAELELANGKSDSGQERLQMARKYDGANPRLDALRDRLDAVTHDKPAFELNQKGCDGIVRNTSDSIFKKAIKSQDMHLLTATGQRYETGVGPAMDAHKAFCLYYTAVQMGDGDAKYRLGYMFAYGRGVKRDIERAKWWFTQAVRSGHAMAATQLKLLK
jgi:serine/threonine protein kinase